jgi:hypothetical protein
VFEGSISLLEGISAAIDTSGGKRYQISFPLKDEEPDRAMSFALATSKPSFYTSH